jgi:hypothetical protein
MTANQLFSLLNLLAMSGWILLAAFPRRAAIATVAGRVIPGLLALAYLVVIAMNWRGSEGGFSSLPDVAKLFANPWLLLAGWTHYLAFDLLIGSWQVRDAQERGINHLLVLPCLLLTLLFGPAGWLLYLGLRTVSVRR